jgi:hypothetical protein
MQLTINEWKFGKQIWVYPSVSDQWGILGHIESRENLVIMPYEMDL